MTTPRQFVLFVRGAGSDNVVLNWTGKPAENLESYAAAFHRAGRRLADEYVTSGRVWDSDACPLVFLYRHSLELYLKAILIPGNKLLRLRREAPLDLKRHLGNHRLLDFLPDIERVMAALRWNWGMSVEGLRSREQFKNVLNELDRVDQRSFSFRYPMGKDGNALLPEHFSFSVGTFASRMDALLGELDGVVTGVEQAFEGEAEYAAELRQYELEQQAEYESWCEVEYSTDEPEQPGT